MRAGRRWEKLWSALSAFCMRRAMVPYYRRCHGDEWRRVRNEPRRLKKELSKP